MLSYQKKDNDIHTIDSREFHSKSKIIQEKQYIFPSIKS